MGYPPTKIKPWKHQIEAWELASKQKSFYLAHQMGCGKTKSAIDYCNGVYANRILIICPKKVMSVWPNQFKIHSHKDYDVIALNNNKPVSKKATQLKDFIRQKETSGQPFAVVLNYESFWRPPMGPVYKKNRRIEAGLLLTLPWDLIIADEAHRCKSPGGAASWGLTRLCRQIDRRLFLSGTPMPHSPVDIYAQFRALDPSVFGTSFAIFRQRYCVMGGFENRQIVKFINIDDLNKRFYSKAHYVKSEDALDLPEKQDITISCNLDNKAMKIYRELDKEFIAEVDKNEITADNALVKLLRLAQIAGGYLKLDDGTTKVIDDNKIDTVIEILRDLPETEPVVIFCRFRNELRRLTDKIEKEFSQRKVGEISGRMSGPYDFYDGIWHATDTNTLLVQISSGGEGIDLTSARYCIYMSIGYSLGQYQQSKSRLHRPGQTRKVIYYHIVANGTVDTKIISAIKSKRRIVDSVLHQYKSNMIL